MLNRFSLRKQSWAAWLLVVLYATLVGFGLVFQRLTGFPEETFGPLEFWFAAFSLFWMAGIGTLILSRYPRHPIGWALYAFPLFWAFGQFSFGYAGYTLITNPGSLLFGTFIAMLDQGSNLIATLPLTFLFLLFPNGRPLTPKWRLTGWLAIGTAALLFIRGALEPRLLNDRIPNPIQLQPFLLSIEPLVIALFVLQFFAMVTAAVSLFLRMRGAEGVEKQQIKWFVYAISFLPLGLGLLFFGPSRATDFIAILILAAAFSGMSLAVGFAIFRYRLWDIDLIIRRTLVYTVLTVLLAGIYFGSVIVLQYLFRLLSGRTGESQVAVIVSTLAIAALFTPLRRGIQTAIDRRFYRSKVDAEQTLAEFSAMLREEVDLETIAGNLMAAVEKTMQPESVSLWLKESSEQKVARPETKAQW